MLETRSSYGYGRGSGVTDKATLAKYQVCYRDKWGGYGEIGYRLFNTREEALAFGENLKREKDYINEIIVKHPSARYSNY